MRCVTPQARAAWPATSLDSPGRPSAAEARSCGVWQQFDEGTVSTSAHDSSTVLVRRGDGGQVLPRRGRAAGLMVMGTRLSNIGRRESGDSVLWGYSGRRHGSDVMVIITQEDTSALDDPQAVEPVTPTTPTAPSSPTPTGPVIPYPGRGYP